MTQGNNQPLYWRLLRLRRVRPGGAMRVLLVEGLALVGLLLTLAVGVTAWSILILPAVGAVVVKAHDVLARWL
jgi:hypothetical protein